MCRAKTKIARKKKKNTKKKIRNYSTRKKTVVALKKSDNTEVAKFLLEHSPEKNSRWLKKDKNGSISVEIFVVRRNRKKAIEKRSCAIINYPYIKANDTEGVMELYFMHYLYEVIKTTEDNECETKVYKTEKKKLT